jgi:hypothetical protein
LQAIAAIVLLAVVGAGMLVGGVFILAGHGFALLAGGALLIISAVILRSGLTPNG